MSVFNGAWIEERSTINMQRIYQAVEIQSEFENAACVFTVDDKTSKRTLEWKGGRENK